MAKKKKYLLTLDQFFKQCSKRYFEAQNCEVQAEVELITGPKRVDIIVIKKIDFNAWEKDGIFSYFLEHNLISFKSFRDTVSIRDLNDCFIYFYSYLQITKEAHLKNTTITIITSKIPKKILETYKNSMTKLSKACYELQGGTINLRIINIEEVDLYGQDGAFLSIFCKDTKRIKKESEQVNKNFIDTIQELINARLYHFEGVRNTMGAVADITDVVEAKIEEVKKKTAEEVKKKTAIALLAKNYLISDISEITELSIEEIKKLKR